MLRHQRHSDVTCLPYFAFECFLPINDRLLLIMTENDANLPINNDPIEKRNEFIDHPSYLYFSHRLHTKTVTVTVTFYWMKIFAQKLQGRSSNTSSLNVLGFMFGDICSTEIHTFE